MAMTEPLAPNLIARLREAAMYVRNHALLNEAADVLTTLQQTVAQQQRELLKWEEREARVCPEDVGFQEQIRTLQQTVARLQADNAKQYESWGHEVKELEQTRETLRAELDKAIAQRLRMQVEFQAVSTPPVRRLRG